MLGDLADLDPRTRVVEASGGRAQQPVGLLEVPLREGASPALEERAPGRLVRLRLDRGVRQEDTQREGYSEGHRAMVSLLSSGANTDSSEEAAARTELNELAARSAGFVWRFTEEDFAAGRHRGRQIIELEANGSGRFLLGPVRPDQSYSARAAMAGRGRCRCPRRGLAVSLRT